VHTWQLMVAHECQFRIPDLLMLSFEPWARASGLQFHYPFLSLPVIALGARLEFHRRYWHDRGQWWAKKALRDAVRSLVPLSIPMRRRVAYDLPMRLWLKTPRFHRRVVETIADSPLWSLGFLSPRLRARFLEWRRFNASLSQDPESWLARTWSLLVLAAWCARFRPSAALTARSATSVSGDD
jgi:hypothetical protein